MKPESVPLLKLLVVGLACLLYFAHDAQTQVVQIRPVPVDTPPAEAQKSDDESVSSVSMLESNADADALLMRARSYMQDQQYREALLLLQAATDRYGQYLAEDEDGVFLPTRRLVEKTLARWAKGNPTVLEQYRLAADPEARGLLGGPVEQCIDIKSLDAVVRRFFLSSVGDDAAFRLACLSLDQGDYTQAAVLLRKIVGEYPSPTVDAQQLHIRLAMAHARLGSTVGFKRSLAALADMHAPTDLLEHLQGELARIEATSPAAGQWQMDWGNPQRNGVMSSLGDISQTRHQRQWVGLWQFRDPSIIRNLQSGTRQSPVSRAELTQRWSENGWRPTAQAVFDGDIMYTKLGDSLVAVDTHLGDFLWRADSQAPPQQAQQIVYGRSVVYYRPQNNWPATQVEAALFGDRTDRTIALHNGILYYIESSGPSFSAYPRRAILIINGRRQFATTQSSRLVAFDIARREVRWRATVPSRINTKQQGQVQQVASFTAPPIAVGDRLIAVVSDQGELNLVSLSQDEGKVQWKKFLCSAPEGYAPPWAATGLTVEGDTVYVVTGVGFLVAANAQTGEIQWASRYPRVVLQVNRYGAGQLSAQAWATTGQPWDDNVVFPVGGALVVAAADSPQFHIYDKLTGQLRHSITALRRSDPTGQYALGVRAGLIYIGNDKELACFDAQSGELKWRSDIPESTGRAVLTTDAIYASTDGGLVRINADTGKWVSRISIAGGPTDPIGNLVSNGRHLLSLGVDGVQAFGDVDREFERLAAPVAQGEPVALYQRARLYEKLDQPAKAVADLKQAVPGLSGDFKQRAQRLLVVNLMVQARLDQKAAPNLLDEAYTLADTDTLRAAVALERARYFEKTGNFAEAIDLYLKYASADGAQLITVDPSQPGWQIAAEELGAWRLRELAHASAGSVSALLESNARQAWNALPDDSGMASLWPIAKAYPSTNTAYKILSHVAEQTKDPSTRSFGQGEAFLRELERTDSGPNAAASLMMLAEVYDRRGWHRDAANIWRTLRQHHTEVELNGTLGAQPVATLAEQQIKQLTKAAKSDVDPRRLQSPPTKPLWYSHAVEQQMLEMASGDEFDHNEYLLSHVLFYSPGLRRITCRDPAKGWKAVWSKRLPEDVEENVRRSSFVRWLYGGVDENVLVVLTPSKTLAIGLVDGQALWEIDTPRQMNTNSRAVTPAMRRGRNNPIDINNGVIAEVVNDANTGTTCVQVRDLITGHLLWQRSPEQDVVGGVWVRGRRVIIAMNGGSSLWLCDRRTGRKLGEVDIRGSSTNGYYGMFDDGVIYTASNALRFAPFDEGRQRWVKGSGGRSGLVNMIHPVSDELFLAVWASGDLSLMKTQTGEELWRKGRDEVGRLLDASLGDDGLVYLLGTSMRNILELRSYKPLSGELNRAVTFSNLLASHRFCAGDLAHVGDIVPFLERDRSRHTNFEPVLVNAAESKEIARLLPPSGFQFDRLVQAPRIRGNCIIITTQSGMMAFGPNDGRVSEPEPQAQPQAAQAVPDVTVRNGRMEIRTPGGGVIRAGGRIRINNIEYRLNGEVIEIYQDGKLIEKRPVNQPVDLQPEPNPPVEQKE